MLEGGGSMNTGKGQVTDDSEMALAIFHGLCNILTFHQILSGWARKTRSDCNH